ncbi:hypothetical protein [Streptomyces sp. NPDC048565]|uniref:hypothetical protein n=1 Tax=Streptomyces sp. NPDC048565 TaxID=3155266 RepID=UPI00341357CE
MAMTLKVYAVDRDGNRHVVRPEIEVAPLAHVEPVSAWAACKCPRCASASPIPPAQPQP